MVAGNKKSNIHRAWKSFGPDSWAAAEKESERIRDNPPRAYEDATFDQFKAKPPQKKG